MANIALIPGGFKPPTLGHFHIVNEVSNRSEIDKTVVLIGHGNRDGITPEDSLAIWDIYKKYMPSNVEIKISENSSPIKDIIKTVMDNPDNFYYTAVGYRGEEDKRDLYRFNSLERKGATNFKTIIIKGEFGVSGTKARKELLDGNFEGFQKYVPTELSMEDRKKVWDILTQNKIEENDLFGLKSTIREIFNDYPQSTPTKTDRQLLLGQIKSLTEYMIDKGMNIKPLPKLKIIDDDEENANDFFGKTAYYDPSKNLIVIYTMGRHPKDCTRSYCHEMIHRIQNNENRLNNISTTNTNEDGELLELEKEAYLKGNITFRNWTDSITNPKQLNEGRYDKLTTMISSDIFKKWKQGFETGKKYAILDTFYEGGDIKLTVVAKIFFIPGYDKYRVDGSMGEDGETLLVDFKIDPTYLPDFWEDISMDLRDVVRHEIEHATQTSHRINSRAWKYMEDDTLARQLIKSKLVSKSNYFKLKKEVDANLQGLYLKAKKSKQPFSKLVNDYLDLQDITPEQKEEVLKIWRNRIPALSLPKI